VNRAARRAMAGELRKQAKQWPEQLVEVPESEWPEIRGHTQPVAALRSRSFLVQIYVEPFFAGKACHRLTANRVTIGAGGHWQDGITWDELQRLKREAGYGDWYGVEVYPRDRDAVTDCNMRHLWLLERPLPLGWFTAREAP
jgi:hypothetical protein